jgi:ribosomal protein S27AE
MQFTCPGTANLRNPTLELRTCPQCGEEIEIFSDEMKASCGRCGFVIYNDIISCVRWCRYAKECVGEEMYRKITGKEGGGDKW